MGDSIEGIDLSPAARRKVFETAFEQFEGGWVYYRSSWSKGVPVTAEERELFVDDWTPEKSAEFHRLIAGRRPVTPARGLRPLGDIARALPVGVVWALFTGALAAVALVWDATPFWRIVLWVLAGVFFTFAAGLFFLRRFRE